MGVSAYNKTIGSPKGPYYKTIVGRKQEPITNLALPVTTNVAYGLPSVNQYPMGTFCPPSTGGVWQQGTADIGIWPSGTNSRPRYGPRAMAYNKARQRFLDRISSARAQGMTALAERASTMEMVNKRLLQLLKAARALRKGDFKSFLDTLNVKPLDRHRNKGWNRPKEFGGLWLEYWFGWAPTISDIYSLVDAYTNEVNPGYYKAGSRNKALYKFTGGNGSWGTTTLENYDCSCTIGALCKVTNNDLLDLNEAGLLNPAQTALELIPFSWFLGWFVNLSSVLGSLTDTIGLKFENGWISEKTTRNCTHREVNKSSGAIYGMRDYETISFCRSLFTELPTPTIEWSLPLKLSVTRGATLVSLLAVFAPAGKRTT